MDEKLIDILGGISGCFSFGAGKYGVISSLFLAGLVSSVTHCAGMCGPFVIAQSGQMRRLRDAALVPYHMGRMTTYVLMGVAFYTIFNLALLFMPVRSYVTAPLLALAGIIFFVNAFSSRLGTMFPWALRVRIPFANRLFGEMQSCVGRIGNVWGRREGLGIARTYLMGVLLGFMPCGLVVSALMAAVTLPTLYDAVLAMSVFALGTMPGLIIVALGGRALSVKYPKLMGQVRHAILIWSGVWLFVMAYTGLSIDLTG